MWSLVYASSSGPREANEDYLSARVYNRISPNAILAISDGIGSLPRASHTSSSICEAAANCLERFLITNRTDRSPLYRLAWPSSLLMRMSRLRTNDIRTDSGATLAAIAIKKRRAFFTWAGDSRIYFLTGAGALCPLTKDHHDADQNLTSYYSSNGKLVGTLGSYSLRLNENIRAIALTTDGVHESCSANELRKFILYCMIKKVQTKSAFDRILNEFVAHNAQDNYSMILFHKHSGISHLKSIY